MNRLFLNLFGNNLGDNAAFVIIKRIDRREIASRCAHELKSVFFSFGKSFFVGKNDPLGKVAKLNFANDTRKAIIDSIHIEFLAINENTLFFVTGNYAVVVPFVKKRTCLVIFVLALGEL